MKLSIQQTLLVGKTLKEKFERAAAFGFDGVELAAWGFAGPMYESADEIAAAMAATGVKISSCCSMGSDDFVHPDSAERQARLDRLVRMLDFAGEVGAAGVVALPIRPPVHLPDLSPLSDERALITGLAVAMLKEALSRSKAGSAAVFLEPLNRYEAYYLRTLSDAVALAKTVEDSRAMILADLFHMNIEEADIAASIRAAGRWIGHVHLADSNRLLPGHGHIDFAAAFGALRTIGYDGWLALECGVPGDPNETLPAAATYLRARWEEGG